MNDDHTLYVSDTNNNRVMKCMKGAKQGKVVADGNDLRNQTTQLSRPSGSDTRSDRIMRWYEGLKEREIVVGANRKGREANHLNSPISVLFDNMGNLYVADYGNDRIQEF